MADRTEYYREYYLRTKERDRALRRYHRKLYAKRHPEYKRLQEKQTRERYKYVYKIARTLHITAPEARKWISEHDVRRPSSPGTTDPRSEKFRLRHAVAEPPPHDSASSVRGSAPTDRAGPR